MNSTTVLRTYTSCESSDVTEWLPRWLEIDRKNVKHDGYFRLKGVYLGITECRRYIFVLTTARLKEIMTNVASWVNLGGKGCHVLASAIETLHSLCLYYIGETFFPIFHHLFLL